MAVRSSHRPKALREAQIGVRDALKVETMTNKHHILRFNDGCMSMLTTWLHAPICELLATAQASSVQDLEQLIPEKSSVLHDCYYTDSSSIKNMRPIWAAFDTWCNTTRERYSNDLINYALDTPGTMAKFLSWFAELKIATRHRKQKTTPTETGRNAIKHGVEAATKIAVWQGYDTMCVDKKDGGMFVRHDLVAAVRRKYNKLVELQSTVAGIDSATHTKGCQPTYNFR
ncbi:hypothetical protein WJX72_004377 [[Myrmecia] bisecta]|uniref:Uncharacterized protein n=1 Tax=[Myrmecia] bisecta TaxID=41462 RepID=A0AAW1QEX9_9CHLO